MLIVALVLAVIGLAALVTAVVTSNELIAWVCIGASVIGVLLLIVDALRERRGSDVGTSAGAAPDESEDPADPTDATEAEDYPEESSEVTPEAETTSVSHGTNDDPEPDAKRD